MLLTEITLEAITSCTLDRDGERVSLRRGALLKIAGGDESLNWRQVDRLMRDNRLRCTAGRAALAERVQEASREG